MDMEEDKQFLQLQREQGRPGRMGLLDREFLRKKALVQKKLEDRERHRRQEAEERVTREKQAILLSKNKNNICY